MSEWKELHCRVGRNIHATRVGQAMPLAKLARLSGLSAETIDRLELGKSEEIMQTVLRNVVPSLMGSEGIKSMKSFRI